MRALDQARKRARKAIESMYDGVCMVIEFGKVKDPVTKVTGSGEVVVLEGQPCRLSFSTLPTTSQTDTVANLTQSIKLFLAPGIVIKPGSKITVIQNGRTTVYKNSGEPAFYTTHQEISLELYEGKA